MSQVDQFLQDEGVTLVDPPISSILTTIQHSLKGSLCTTTFNCNKGLRDKIPQAAEYARRATAEILHLIETFDKKVNPSEHEVARHIKQASREGYELHSSKYSVILLKKRLAQRMIEKPEIKHDSRLVICEFQIDEHEHLLLTNAYGVVTDNSKADSTKLSEKNKLQK